MTSRWVRIGLVLLAVLAAAVLMGVGIEPWIASAVCVVLSTGSFWCGFVGGYVEGQARDRAEARESGRHPAGKQTERLSAASQWYSGTLGLDLERESLREALRGQGMGVTAREAVGIEVRRQAQADGWLRHIDDSGFTICGKQVAKSPLGAVHCLRDFGHDGDCLP